MNWRVYGLGIAAGIIAWIITGELIVGAIVSIAFRLIGGAITGSKWS
jgi:hypothetical protein